MLDVITLAGDLNQLNSAHSTAARVCAPFANTCMSTMMKHGTNVPEHCASPSWQRLGGGTTSSRPATDARADSQ